MQFAAVIPAFNEAASIALVIKAVAQYAMPIVVDDGSSDSTAQLAESAGAIVVRHGHNQGYDAALQSGIFKAIELGFTHAITLDADGQHAPELLMQFKERLEQGLPLVIGARDRHQRWSEVIFAALGKLLWGVSDPLCGMKGYQLDLVQRCGHFDSYQSIGTEMCLRIVRDPDHYLFSEIAIRTRPRTGASKFGSGLRANFKIVKALLVGFWVARRIEA